MTNLEQIEADHSEPALLGKSPQRQWLRFFLLFLPAAFLSFALLTEGVAYELRGIQPFRNSLDTIAVAAERVHGNARWLIFSDSLTQHVLMDFTLGPPDMIANLTTHAGAGMPSMYLLLRRYLSTHAAPKAILLAMSPETYTTIPNEKAGAFWLTPTFLKPDEQAWLSQFYPSAHVSGWIPAAFDLKASVLDPLTGLLAGPRDTLITGAEQPDPNMPVEAPLPPTKLSIESDEERAARHLELTTSRDVLTDICYLARQNGIAVHLILVPLPAAVHKAWEERGDLARLNQQVTDLLTKQCGQFFLYDMSKVIQIPNFDDGGMHIVGHGWRNRYALALKEYIDSVDKAYKWDDTQ
jgi:hypothetical protein